MDRLPLTCASTGNRAYNPGRWPDPLMCPHQESKLRPFALPNQLSQTGQSQILCIILSENILLSDTHRCTHPKENMNKQCYIAQPMLLSII